MKATTIDGLMRYMEHGLKPGEFLTAVLENNLLAAMGQADEQNRADIFEICQFVYNKMPMNCHGSPAIVKTWVDSFKVKGKKNEQN